MDNDSFLSSTDMPDLPLWKITEDRHIPLSFELELTARCNNDCRHCYINLPAKDRQAMRRELSLEEIDRIADQAVELGALWCLITGGEPLLRHDFEELYMLLKRKGMMVTVFTNACLVTEKHVRLFQQYPPRDIEVSVYGASRETYERVTRKPGSFAAFRRGLDLLLAGGIKVRLNAMVLKSNVQELPEISSFCRGFTKDYYRFDPLLHLRYDGDPARNAEIQAERLSPDEIVAVEQADQERAEALKKECSELISSELSHTDCNHLFHCGAGKHSFSVTYDGKFQLCSTLNQPDCVYDLRKGSLAEAWNTFTSRIRALESESQDFHDHCRTCPLINLCLWCPARAYLECGRMDGRSDYFCQVAHARAQAITLR